MRPSYKGLLTTINLFRGLAHPLLVRGYVPLRGTFGSCLDVQLSGDANCFPFLRYFNFWPTRAWGGFDHRNKQVVAATTRLDLTSCHQFEQFDLRKTQPVIRFWGNENLAKTQPSSFDFRVDAGEYQAAPSAQTARIRKGPSEIILVIVPFKKHRISPCHVWIPVEFPRLTRAFTSTVLGRIESQFCCGKITIALARRHVLLIKTTASCLYIYLYGIHMHYILYCITLYYIMLYHIISYYVISYCIILYYIILHHITLYYIILYYIILHHITLHYITLHYILLYHIILYYIT